MRLPYICVPAPQTAGNTLNYHDEIKHLHWFFCPPNLKIAGCTGLGSGIVVASRWFCTQYEAG